MKEISKMRAAVLYDWNDFKIVDRDIPEPGDSEVLIKVKSCSICAGDIKIIGRGMPKQPPMGEFIIGHEYAGSIVKLGPNVDEFDIGDRVTVEVHKGCDLSVISRFILKIFFKFVIQIIYKFFCIHPCFIQN